MEMGHRQAFSLALWALICLVPHHSNELVFSTCGGEGLLESPLKQAPSSAAAAALG